MPHISNWYSVESNLSNLKLNEKYESYSQEKNIPFHWISVDRLYTWINIFAPLILIKILYFLTSIILH